MRTRAGPTPRYAVSQYFHGAMPNPPDAAKTDNGALRRRAESLRSVALAFALPAQAAYAAGFCIEDKIAASSIIAS